MNKFSAKTIALIVVLVILAAAAWFMFGGSVSGGLNYANADKYTVGDTTVTSPVENLDIDWTSGPVNIEYHAGSGISVSETANKTLSEDDRLRWWLDGTTLRIRYAKSGIRFSFNLEKKLTVSLPEGTVLKQADIGTTSGDLFIPALAADDIRLNSTSGSIDAVTTTLKLYASSTSGNVKVRQDGDIGAVDLSSTSGSVSCVLGGSVKTLNANSTSGSVSLDQFHQRLLQRLRPRFSGTEDPYHLRQGGCEAARRARLYLQGGFLQRRPDHRPVPGKERQPVHLRRRKRPVQHRHFLRRHHPRQGRLTGRSLSRPGHSPGFFLCRGLAPPAGNRL